MKIFDWRKDKYLTGYQMMVVGLVVFLTGALFLLEKGLRYNEKQFPLEVSFLNVGQGDAILINYHQRVQILIDGGPSGKIVLTELSKVMPKFDNTIELLVVTHPDRDHFAGLFDVVHKYKIQRIIYNGQNPADEVWQSWRKLINEKKIPLSVVGEGSSLKIGKDLNISFFNPDYIEENTVVKNDSSIVMRLDYLNNSFLFTGDLSSDGEADMIFDGEDIDVDWLKVAHHGSDYSTSQFFLARSTPRWAIISVGENEYGHPSKGVLQRLQKAGAEILRTDKQGTITIKLPVE